MLKKRLLNGVTFILFLSRFNKIELKDIGTERKSHFERKERQRKMKPEGIIRERYKQKEIKIERKKDGQKERKTDRKKERKKEIKTDRKKERKKERKIDRKLGTLN